MAKVIAQCMSACISTSPGTTTTTTVHSIILTLVEFLHFDIQSTGQKSHCVNTVSGHRNALF